MGFWKKLGVGASVLAVAVGGPVVGNAINGQTDTSSLQSQISALHAQIVADSSATNATLSTIVASNSAIQNEVFQVDGWKSTAEVLSLTDIESSHFKDVSKFVLSSFPTDFANGTVWTDLRSQDRFSVTEGTQTVTSFDTTNKDATVTTKLTVRYEDKTGKSVRRNVLATTQITADSVDGTSYAVI